MEIGVMSREMRRMVGDDRADAPLPPKGGACSGEPTQWWYPPHGAKREEQTNAKKAVEICRSCELRRNCLDYSIRWEAFGIWAGFTERQRDLIRKNNRVTQVRINLANSRTRSGYNGNFELQDLHWLKKNGL
jgi:hypothetical protein